MTGPVRALLSDSLDALFDGLQSPLHGIEARPSSFTVGRQCGAVAATSIPHNLEADRFIALGGVDAALGRMVGAESHLSVSLEL